MNTNAEPRAERAVEVVRSVVKNVSDDERAALLAWARELLRIRESNLPIVRKAQLALRATATADVAKPLVQVLARQGKTLGIQAKKLLWDDRGWIARTGLAGITVGTLVFGGESAGIAAFGGAVGVPLWLVLGAGGAVLGALVEELGRPPGPTTTYSVIEAHRVDSSPAESVRDRSPWEKNS